MGATIEGDPDMKFMLTQSYAPTEVAPEPITEWAPEDAKAHIDFQVEMNKELTKRGELVEAQALTGPDEARIVVSDGSGAPVITDGPFPESKEFLAGYRMIEVDSLERALEIAARASAAPGPGGQPIKTPIEVREVMGAP
jgi:hypothetical protein